MPHLIVTVLLGALGFLLGFFYTRTVKLAEKLPEKYETREQCRAYRLECHHTLEIDRAEVIERIRRIEAKLDRIIEMFMPVNQARARSGGGV